MKKLFDHHYRLNPNQQYSPSLIEFFIQNVQAKLPSRYIKVLDLGCGNFSIFEDVVNLDAHVTAIDFSEVAIAQTPRNSIINYSKISLTDEAFFKNNVFDLVFDSHCFHCLGSENERALGLKNIFNSLAVDGFFAAELMIQPTNCLINIPNKIIKTAQEVEQELIAVGFNILYFAISNDQEFCVDSGAERLKCDMLKIIATKY